MDFYFSKFSPVEYVLLALKLIPSEYQDMPIFLLSDDKSWSNKLIHILSNSLNKKITIISADNISNNIPYCPISVGVNFLDQAYNLEKIENINFSNLAYPLLVVPFLSRSSEIIGKKILLNLENFKFLFNFNQSILSNFDNSLISKTTNFLISFNQNEDSFDEKTWDSLYKISQKTFVDETESSKKTSAGAGLTDND